MILTNPHKPYPRPVSWGIETLNEEEPRWNASCGDKKLPLLMRIAYIGQVVVTGKEGTKEFF